MNAPTPLLASDGAARPAAPSTTLRAIAIGGAVVGVLDAADGVVYAGITAGQNPIQVLQWIATGALGPSAFEGGLAAAALGAAMHFALAYAFTAAFVIAWSKVEAIRNHWLVAGAAWGAAVWAFMNLLVLPLSQVPHEFTVASVLNGVVGHALTVGVAAAYVAKRVTGAGGSAR